MALVQFQAAEQSFSARLTDLQQLSTDAQDPAWVQDLLHVFAADDRGGEHMQVMMQNWQERLGHTDWLEWLATDRVDHRCPALFGQRLALAFKFAALDHLAGTQFPQPICG